MANPLRRGESPSQVSDWHPSSSNYTAPSQTSFFAPHGLTLRQTITSSGAVTIPTGIEWVYVIMTGAGGNEDGLNGGGAGGLAWGWTLAQSTCIIGAPSGGYTRYGHIIAGGGGSGLAQGYLGGGTGGGNTNAGTQNYYGQPGSFPGEYGVAAGGSQVVMGVYKTSTPGISAGGGASAIPTGYDGGNGFIGGGGGAGFTNNLSTITGGKGGNAIGIDGTIYTGGNGATGSVTDRYGGGGGAGIAGNGGNASGNNGGNGGLGGGGGGGSFGGTGGAGILYIFY